MSVDTSRWQFTSVDFLQMARTGILNEDDRVELIDGEVRVMSPIGPSHSGVGDCLNELLIQALAQRANVRVKSSVLLNEFTQPQPDVAILRRRTDFYRDKLPEPNDILLLIEVADSSRKYDRDEKIPRYAAAGILETWLIDLAAATVKQYLQPAAAGYQSVRTFVRGQTFNAMSLPGLTLALNDIFGQS